MGQAMPRKLRCHYHFIQTARPLPLSHVRQEMLKGFCSFVQTTDPSGVYCIYHATPSPTDGWANRKAHIRTPGPERFLHSQTIICRLTLQPEAHVPAHGPAMQIHGHTRHSGEPKAQDPTRSRLVLLCEDEKQTPRAVRRIDWQGHL